jgi:hypothetical protein
MVEINKPLIEEKVSVINKILYKLRTHLSKNTK